MINSYFDEQMKQLLAEEYPAFRESLEQPLFRSLRINRARTSEDELKQNGFVLKEQSLFDLDTYYIDQSQLGNHPFHNGGLYYLQEPSATMAVNALDVREGNAVLDMCAAPGGKSTQILSRLNGTGLLVSNEINSQRCNALLGNIERWGYNNYILCNDTPENIAESFTGFFDRVLVDAPCSGTAMFRKYPESIQQYDEKLVLMNQRRQLQILDQAASCLKKDGVLVYSTCTFNQQEDEEVIWTFLQNHSEFTLEDSGLSCARTGFPFKDLDHTKLRRALPMDRGEGHFVARMRKSEDTGFVRIRQRRRETDRLVDEFLNQQIQEKISYSVIAGKAYYLSSDPYDVRCRTLRSGILIGEIVKNRFEPAHQFYLANDLTFRNRCDLDDIDVITRFMKGEVITVSGIKGFVQICYRHHPIGFGKGDGHIIKNHYPKGLRLTGRIIDED